MKNVCFLNLFVFALVFSLNLHAKVAQCRDFSVDRSEASTGDVLSIQQQGCDEVKFTYHESAGDRSYSTPLNGSFVEMPSPREGVLVACQWSPSVDLLGQHSSILCTTKEKTTNKLIQLFFYESPGNSPSTHILSFSSDGTKVIDWEFQNRQWLKDEIVPSFRNQGCLQFNGKFSSVSLSVTWKQNDCDSATLVQHRSGGDIVDILALNGQFSRLPSMPQFNTSCSYNNIKTSIICTSYNVTNKKLARVFVQDLTLEVAVSTDTFILDNRGTQLVDRGLNILVRQSN